MTDDPAGGRETASWMMESAGVMAMVLMRT